jgi:hypothetical protein
MRQFSRFRVLNSGEPYSGRRYREIISRPSDSAASSECGILGVEMIQTAPDFEALADGALHCPHNPQAGPDRNAEVGELERMFRLEDPRR